MKAAHWHEDWRKYCFVKLSADEVPCSIRSRTHDVVEFVCAKLKLSPPPEVVWIRPESQDRATEILKRWTQSPGNNIPGTRLPIECVDGIDDIMGYTLRQFPNEIWIRSDLLDFPALELIAAHEVRHAYQKAKAPAVFEDPCDSECDAYPYAYDVLKQYLEEKRKEDLTSEIEDSIKQKRGLKRCELLQRCPHCQFKALDI